MAYSIILPLFFAWLIFSFIALTLVWIKASEWRGRSYLFHASIWSSVGVVIANILFLACLEFSFDHIPDKDGLLRVLAIYVFASTAILGPFVASAIGWFVGILAGLAVAHGRIKNTNA